MKSMKLLWDDLHPELSFFNGKYLRQQSTYTTPRDCILKTKMKNDEETNVIARSLARLPITEKDNITEMISTPLQTEKH